MIRAMATKKRRRAGGGPAGSVGKVRIHEAKIGVGRLGKNLTLLHVPTDRYITLYEHGEAIWNEIGKGVDEIGALIATHAARHGVPRDVAAFEVISFLDELRALGVLDYRLTRERETAPLLDTPISPAELKAEHLARLMAGREPFELPPGGVPHVVIDNPAADTPMSRLLEATGAERPAAAGAIRRRAVVVRHPRLSMSLGDLEALGAAGGAVEQRRLVVAARVPPEMTLAEWAKAARDGASAIPVAHRPEILLSAAAHPDMTLADLKPVVPALLPTGGVTVIIIDWGDGTITVIVIVGGGGGGPGGGGGSGKSRQSCKTMCV